jgi:hypothetical protein
VRKKVCKQTDNKRQYILLITALGAGIVNSILSLTYLHTLPQHKTAYAETKDCTADTADQTRDNIRTTEHAPEVIERIKYSNYISSQDTRISRISE